MKGPKLPSLPTTSLELAGREAGPPGFLTLLRSRYRTRAPGQPPSSEFVYDSIQRRALDAVVMAVYYVDAGEPWIYLRSALRPPVLQRTALDTPDPKPETAHLWELPAGLVEPEEQTPSGLKQAAARETLEELGFDVAPSSFVALDQGVYPSPAMIAEKQFFFRVRVDPGAQKTPELDGSPLEASGLITAIRLRAAIDLCRSGQILDSKTELGLRRLVDVPIDEL